MTHVMDHIVDSLHTGHGILTAVSCLYLHIILQMPGVRGTPLSRASFFDLFGRWIGEGLSIPPAAVPPPPAD